MEQRKRFLELVKELALLRGDFTLASGAQSSYFFDLKMVTLSPEGAYLTGKLVFEILRESGVDAVGGLTLGSDPIVTAVAIVSHLEGKPIPALIVRGELKEHGTQKAIEGNLPTKGSKVAIVEDVITKGGATLKAIEAVEAAGCRVVKVVALLDRHQGGSDELKRRGYNFTAILHADAEGEISTN
ncbi:MAG: orotate phosphoribosyltransferase [Dehalococcoidia bacterium]|nr:orotate phosphoribosyltransferase [Dehalococcoidia bacterium]